MSLDELKSLHVLSCFALCLIIASPAIAMLVSIPTGEGFSQIWLLGADGTADDHPFNIEAQEVYKVGLDVGNRMGGMEYYRVCVKLRNQSEPLPDALDATPSVLVPLIEYRVFVGENEVWEKWILFSFENVSFEQDFCRISRIVLDGHELSVDENVLWNEENNGFYFQLFFELWLYKRAFSDFQYDNRFVGIWLNMTGPV